MKNVRIQAFQSGYCTHNRKMIFPQEKSEKTTFPALFFLLTHEEKGHILFDTGYAPRIYEATRHFPYRLYRRITPIYTDERRSAVRQLKRIGIPAEDIAWVFISHFHADHIAGLKDFSQSRFICSRKGFEYIRDRTGISALKAAFIPSLLPENFAAKAIFTEEQPRLEPKTERPPEIISLCEHFPNIFDVFGDGSLLAVDLSGHAEGQTGLFFHNGRRYYFLVADACWKSRSFQDDVRPHRATRLITARPDLYELYLHRLHRYHRRHPSVLIVPSHCEDACAAVSNDHAT